jgi:gamma-glutamyl-gamma-aminobutyrate hydrolase PuuD
MRIGLSKSIIHHDGFTYDAINQGWYETLGGHSLFCIPNTLNQDFDVIANELDSLILTGGGGYTPKRKAVEMEIVNKMIERNKPIVGIGDSAFEIAELIGGELEPITMHDGLNHPIFYHREVLEVSSYHDRCIKTLPNSATVLCLDYSGNIEAFISKNIAGIVWNPEKMDKPWIPPEIAYMLRI